MRFDRSLVRGKVRTLGSAHVRFCIVVVWNRNGLFGLLAGLDCVLVIG